jgi:hypothetical protein
MKLLNNICLIQKKSTFYHNLLNGRKKTQTSMKATMKATKQVKINQLPHIPYIEFYQINMEIKLLFFALATRKTPKSSGQELSASFSMKFIRGPSVIAKAGKLNYNP